MLVTTSSRSFVLSFGGGSIIRYTPPLCHCVEQVSTGEIGTSTTPIDYSNRVLRFNNTTLYGLQSCAVVLLLVRRRLCYRLKITGLRWSKILLSV